MKTFSQFLLEGKKIIVYHGSTNKQLTMTKDTLATYFSEDEKYSSLAFGKDGVVLKFSLDTSKILDMTEFGCSIVGSGEFLNFLKKHGVTKNFDNIRHDVDGGNMLWGIIRSFSYYKKDNALRIGILESGFTGIKLKEYCANSDAGYKIATTYVVYDNTCWEQL